MVLVELDSNCNLNCRTCPRKRRSGRSGHMSFEIFREIVEKIEASQFENSLYLSGFGESMLNPKFFEMIKYVKQKNFKLIMPTNCTMINEENIKWLRLIDFLQLSIDTLKDEKRRGQNPNDILKLIPSLNKYHINFGLNVALGRENWSEIDDFIRLHIETGTMINFIAIRPIFDDDKFLYNEMRFLSAKIEELKELIRPYQSIFFDESCRSFKYGRMRNNDFAISWDGNLYPCSFAFFRNYSFGNIGDYQNLDGFYESTEMKKIRNGSHSLCSFCKNNDIIANNIKNKNPNRYNYLKVLHNIHSGKKCFVIGNGCSITKEILNKLKNEITIGGNGITFAKSMWEFEPSYICLSDYNNFMTDYYYNELKKSNSPILITEFVKYQSAVHYNKYVTEDIKQFWQSCNFIKWKDAENHRVYIHSADDISLDLNLGTAMCGTIIQDLCLPLAAWIGCNRIYLIGCDCNEEGHFYEDSTTKNDLSSRVTNQYKFFSEKLADDDKKLYNLSPSIIPYIENKRLDDILNDK